MMKILVRNTEKTGVIDYWITFSEVTERGDDMGYFIIGALCFISGAAIGVMLTAIIASGKTADKIMEELNERKDDADDW